MVTCCEAAWAPIAARLRAPASSSLVGVFMWLSSDGNGRISTSSDRHQAGLFRLSAVPGRATEQAAPQTAHCTDQGTGDDTDPGGHHRGQQAAEDRADPGGYQTVFGGVLAPGAEGVEAVGENAAAHHEHRRSTH